MRDALRILASLVIASLLLQSTAMADTFRNVRLVVNTGEKAEEVDAVLRFEDDAVVIYGKGGRPLKTLAYAGIKGAEYSYAKGPRWKSGIGLAVAVGVFALPVFFMKGKKHWLTIAAEQDFAVIRLDKKNYKLILPTFEALTGKRIQSLSEEK